MLFVKDLPALGANSQVRSHGYWRSGIWYWPLAQFLGFCELIFAGTKSLGLDKLRGV